MTVPAYVLFLIQLIFWTWLSEKVNDRMIQRFWSASFGCFRWYLALELVPTTANPWIWYALSALLIGYPYVRIS